MLARDANECATPHRTRAANKRSPGPNRLARPCLKHASRCPAQRFADNQDERQTIEAPQTMWAGKRSSSRIEQQGIQDHSFGAEKHFVTALKACESPTLTARNAARAE